jgi:hypothetical protein
MIAIQNSLMGSIDIYCIGNFTCNISPIIMFSVKIIYVLFWTWILNIICKYVGDYVSWILVLIPYILLFIMILYFTLYNTFL